MTHTLLLVEVRRSHSGSSSSESRPDFRCSCLSRSEKTRRSTGAHTFLDAVCVETAYVKRSD
jgi:hypothetical protein